MSRWKKRSKIFHFEAAEALSQIKLSGNVQKSPKEKKSKLGSGKEK